MVSSSASSEVPGAGRSPPGHFVSSPGQLRAGKGRTRRAKAQRVEPVQSGGGQISYSTPVPANATSTPGSKAVIVDPGAPIEWQALLRMQATWTWQYKSWTPLNPCSSWVDVTCTGGHVTALQPDRNLGGGLTTDFGTLAFLTYFYADDVYIGSSLPSNIGNLRALTAFILSSVSVIGTIPTSFGRCTLLDELDISENGSLFGTIPSTLGYLALLNSLQLEYNQFTAWGEIGKAGTMPNLETLSPYYNLLTNIPTSFYKLVSLTYLNQFDTFIATLPSSLSRMTQLQSINLAYNRLVGTLPSWIPSLPGLTNINMRYNYLTGVIRAPANTTNNFEWNYFSSGICYDYNCQPGCSTPRVPADACASFCGSDGPNGACGGRGTCVPGIPINKCRCRSGRNRCVNSQCTCV